MENGLSSERIYQFDEPFFRVFKIKLIQRKSPTAPYKIQHIKPMSFAAAAVLVYFTSFVMRIIKYMQGSYLELAEIGEVAAISSVYVISFCRGTTLLVHQTEVQRLLRNLEKLFPTIMEDQQAQNVRGYSQTIIHRNKIMERFCSFGCIAFFTKPVLRSLIDYVFEDQEYVYRYPFISWHPFDENRLLSFPIVYFMQAFTSLTGVFFLLNEDLIFTTSVTYMCMYYRHLCRMLSQLDSRRELRSLQQLKKLIKYQYVLEDLRIDVDDIFSLSSFIGFTIMKASLCMFMFSMFHGIDVINMLPFTLAFLALIIPVYLRCSNGTDLHEASASLIDSMYDHNWYEGTPKHRKMIAIMMERANRPVLLQASKVNLICMEYFKEFLLQTYQIFMFLHNFSA